MSKDKTPLENARHIAVELEIRNEAIEEGGPRYRLPNSVYNSLAALVRQLWGELSEDATP